MQPIHEYTDEALIKQLSTGSAPALDELFRRHYVELCQVANRIVRGETEAEDIVQDLFVSLWEKRDTLPELEHAGPYLRRATRNRSLNYLRKQQRLPTIEGDVPEDIPAPTAAGRLERSELRQRLFGAIDRLPERCRLVFTMSKVEHMSHREIAQHLDISVKTVENQMTRAYRYLRQWLALLLILQQLL